MTQQKFWKEWKKGYDDAGRAYYDLRLFGNICNYDDLFGYCVSMEYDSDKDKWYYEVSQPGEGILNKRFARMENAMIYAQKLVLQEYNNIRKVLEKKFSQF